MQFYFSLFLKIWQLDNYEKIFTAIYANFEHLRNR